MTVTGTSGPKTYTLSIPFNAGSFAMSGAIPPDRVLAGQSSNATLSLIPSSGYTGTVALTCNVATISGARCTLNPVGPIVISDSNPAQFDAIIEVPSSAVPGNYSISITGADLTGTPVASAVVTLPVIPFQFTSGTTSQKVVPGQPAAFNLSITPVGGSFQQPVTFSCLNLPPHASCAFSPLHWWRVLARPRLP
jgi:hypothetical protein